MSSINQVNKPHDNKHIHIIETKTNWSMNLWIEPIEIRLNANIFPKYINSRFIFSQYIDEWQTNIQTKNKLDVAQKWFHTQPRRIAKLKKHLDETIKLYYLWAIFSNSYVSKNVSLLLAVHTTFYSIQKLTE